MATSAKFPRLLVFVVLVSGILGGNCLAAQDGKPPRPNIVFILADDIGYGDLGCYGATLVKTPNLDRLARGGMRFVNGYAPSAVCTPTRYALMTGQYAWRHAPGSRILSGVSPLCIPRERPTLPGVIKHADYTTAVIGKWHLGLGEGETNYNGLISPGPRDVGFDESFIIPATGDRTPCVYVQNGEVVGYDANDPIRVSYGKPIGHEPTGAKNPELLTMKHSHGHDNTIINGIGRIGYMTGGKAARWKDEDIADTITNRAVSFIDSHKDAPFFLYFATHDVHVPRVPHPRFRGTSKHGTRGDAIQELDASVGRILDALELAGLTEKTLVVFTSDNGGVMDDGYIDGSGDDKSGHKCNGVLRGFKGGLYEGGTRVPFIVRWPGHVPSDATSRAIISHVDMLATFGAILKVEVPRGAGPDSINQSSALLEVTPKNPPRDTLVLHGGGGGLAIRQGDWKLIPSGGTAGYAAAKQTGKAARGPELYNLANDPSETKNLASEEPDRVAKMTDRLRTIREGGR